MHRLNRKHYVFVSGTNGLIKVVSERFKKMSLILNRELSDIIDHIKVSFRIIGQHR